MKTPSTPRPSSTPKPTISDARKFKQPIYDEFLNAFILTRGNLSFYIDLEGNYSESFKRIQWSEQVIKTELASPYIVGFLQKNMIEVRNIFNPESVYQQIKLESFDLVSLCVAQNLQKKHGGRLDDIFLIAKTQIAVKHKDPKKGDVSEDSFQMFKFQQNRAHQQIEKLQNLQLYSTALKLIDYL